MAQGARPGSGDADAAAALLRATHELRCSYLEGACGTADRRPAARAGSAGEAAEADAAAAEVASTLLALVPPPREAGAVQLMLSEAVDRHASAAAGSACGACSFMRGLR